MDNSLHFVFPGTELSEATREVVHGCTVYESKDGNPVKLFRRQAYIINTIK